MEIYGEYDIVVVGGGVAGCAAAIASARAGAKKDITPHELEKDVSEVQKILEKQGAILHTKY